MDLDDTLFGQIEELASEIHPRLVQLREFLHQIPELAFAEHETTKRLAEEVSALGMTPQTEQFDTGLIVEVSHPTSQSGPKQWICLRADIDAVDNSDGKPVLYASRRPGVMHGCGHDVHSCIMLGAMWVLDSLVRSDPANKLAALNIRVIFQPAEEVARGAEYMIEKGALDQADSVFALHVDPRLACGEVALAAGKITAICDELEIEIKGESGHAARPYETVDPIQAAAQLVNAVYVNVPRSVDPRHSVVVSFGHIAGGRSGNVIPEKVQLKGTIRCHDEEQRGRAIASIRQTCQGIAQASGLQIQANFGKFLPAVDNSERLFPAVEAACLDTVGDQNVKTIDLPSLGGEDFAYYQQHVDGFMVRIGSTSDTIGGAVLHNSMFDVDPETIRIGVSVVAKYAVLAATLSD